MNGFFALLCDGFVLEVSGWWRDGVVYGGRHNKSCNALITSAATSMTLAIEALTLDIDLNKEVNN